MKKKKKKREKKTRKDTPIKNKPVSKPDSKADGKLDGKLTDGVLSSRETEILQLIADGMGSKKIAIELSISFDTVESHRKNIHKKIDVSTAAEAIAYGFRNNLIK